MWQGGGHQPLSGVFELRHKPPKSVCFDHLIAVATMLGWRCGYGLFSHGPTLCGRPRSLVSSNRRYERILVVVKHTPYEAYKQLQMQGKAPKALRWERLRDRHESHRACVDELCDIVHREVSGEGNVRVVSREDLGPQHIEGADLLIAVGGDGTVLSSAHYVDSQLRGRNVSSSGPVVLGVNSDPTKPHERLAMGGTKERVAHVAPETRDERRSFGALCYASANDMSNVLPRVLRGQLNSDVQVRHRMAVTVRSTLAETRLPPALNDVLVAHPSPAAVSRFRLDRRAFPGAASLYDFSFNVWSSGIWISTATGASAAMASAGGKPQVDKSSSQIQYMVRELLIGETDDADYARELSHGVFDNDYFLQIRWNSQHGSVWIDGQHTKFDIELGDEVRSISYLSVSICFPLTCGVFLTRSLSPLLRFHCASSPIDLTLSPLIYVMSLEGCCF